jgi:imidazolonepropionase-like amidohydrolase
MVLHLRGPVLLDDERVAGQAWVVGDRITFERPAGPVDAEVDGWVLPGLVDVHCHVGLAAMGAVDAATAERQALADRDSGVLLIRDAGSPSDTRWIDDRPDLPRILRAGHHLALPKRYLRYYGRELLSPDELPGAVREEAARGDGWVKIVGDWIDRDGPGDLTPLWSDELVTAAIATAHEAGARVTVHTFATETVDVLLDAGVDCLEHATGASPEQIERIAAAGIPVTPTMLQVDRFEEIAAGATRYPLYAARMREMYARRDQQVRDLFDAGVPILVGTDAGGTIPHGRLPDEAAALVAAGLPAREVVAAASWRTRAWLGARSLEEGAPADLVVYPADPREDVRVLAAPTAVVLRGSRVA